MNGANGMSDIEGKAAMGSGERRGSGVRFNTDFKQEVTEMTEDFSVASVCSCKNSVSGLRRRNVSTNQPGRR